MKKKIISILLLIILFVTVGCDKIENNGYSKSNTIQSNTEKKSVEKITIENIESKIKNLGISVEKSESYYEMVGATAGFKLNSGDTRIEIYKFDKNSDVYKIAERNQSLSIDDDYSFDAVVKNGYAYVIDEDFPNYSEVVKLLNQLE